MNRSHFLTDSLQISNVKTILFMFVLLACFTGMKWMKKKKVLFLKQMLLGTGMGSVVGLLIQMVAGFPKDPSSVSWLTEVSTWYGLVGNGYMDLLKMLVIPLIFVSITRVIINMESENLGKIKGKAIRMLGGTTVIAAAIGTILAVMFQVGVGMNVIAEEATIREMNSIVETLRGLLPNNMIKSMADGNVIAVVILASFIGMAVRRQRKKYEDVVMPFIKWIEAVYTIMVSVAMTIIKVVPYAIIAMLSNTIIFHGIQVLIHVGKFIVVFYLALIAIFMVHLAIAWTKGVTPIQYVKCGAKPLVLAFTSRSSSGTLPVLVETLDKEFGVKEGIASVVGNLGCKMGMNGCSGVFPAMVTVTLAQMTNTPMDLSFFLMLVIVIIVSSFGIAGIPGTATLSIAVTIVGVGMSEYLPLIGVILAVDPILDMGRTLLNVSGIMLSAIVTGKRVEQ